MNLLNDTKPRKENRRNEGRWENANGRNQLGPGRIVMWSIRPDLLASTLYQEVLQQVHGYFHRIPQAARLVHLESAEIPQHFRRIFVNTLRPGDAVTSELQKTFLGEKLVDYPLFSFPGSIPHSLMRSEIPIFYDGVRRYVYLYKGDGQRLFLVFLRLRGRNICFFLTRTCYAYLLPEASYLTCLFDGTIIDVELIHENEYTRRLEAFDCVSLCGHLVGHYDYLTRMHFLHYFCRIWAKTQTEKNDAVALPRMVLDEPYSPTRADMPYSPTRPTYLNPLNPGSPPPAASRAIASEETAMWDDLGIEYMYREQQEQAKKLQTELDVVVGHFLLKPKWVYSIWELYSLIYEVLPSMPAYAQEGLIAMPVEDPILPGPCPRIKKIKPGASNTGDMLLGQHDATVTLWGEVPTRELDLMPKNLTRSDLRDYKDTKVAQFASLRPAAAAVVLVREDGTNPVTYKWEQLVGKIVECKFDGKQWQPVRLRDKRKPNTLQTLLRTWQNIQENLTYADIFPFLSDEANRPTRLTEAQRALNIDNGFVDKCFSHLKYLLN